MRRLRAHLTYANVAATLALVLAVAGGTAAVAGVKIAPKNSVTTKSIRKGNVTATDLTNLVRVSSTASISPSSANTATAECPAGMRAISGTGGVESGGTLLSMGLTGNARGWFTSGTNGGGSPVRIDATAWCINNRPGNPFTTN